MKNIDKIIKEEIKRERYNYLSESFMPLNDIKNDKFFSEQFIEKSLDLLDEGYSIEEINLIAEQNFGERIGNSAWGALQKLLGTTDVKRSLGGGTISAVSEYALQWIMTDILGLKPGMAKFAATFLADVKPMDLLKPFKTHELCIETMPTISTGLMEAIVGNAMGTPNQGWKQAAQSEIRNVAFEMVRESNIGLTFANKICGIIWKTNDVNPEQTNPTNPVRPEPAPIAKLPPKGVGQIPSVVPPKTIRPIG